MRNPFDQIPPVLTDAAEEDKKIFYAAIVGAKGKDRMRMIAAFCDRYGEPPHLPQEPSRDSRLFESKI